MRTRQGCSLYSMLAMADPGAGLVAKLSSVPRFVQTPLAGLPLTAVMSPIPTTSRKARLGIGVTARDSAANLPGSATSTRYDTMLSTCTSKRTTRAGWPAAERAPSRHAKEALPDHDLLLPNGTQVPGKPLEASGLHRWRALTTIARGSSNPSLK